MPTEKTNGEYLKLGKNHYTSKEFQPAIDAFSAGIANEPSMELYDRRAACYVRLNDFTSAVKDGRAMIKLDKTNVRGYLRTANVLEKMEKPLQALAIYNYGMKNLPKANEDYKLLQKLHNKLTIQLADASNVDPLVLLPLETAEAIFKLLGFKTMVKCMRVSKVWHRCISNLRSLWLHLDLSSARKAVPRSFVNKAVNNSGKRLNRFTVYQFEHLDVINNIAKHCRELAHVEIISLYLAAGPSLVNLAVIGENLKKLVLRNEMSINTAHDILKSRPTLEHAEFTNLKSNGQWPNHTPTTFPNLKVLRFRSPKPTNFHIPWSGPVAYPALEDMATTTRMDFLHDGLHDWPLKRAAFAHWCEQVPYLPQTVENIFVHPHRPLECDATLWNNLFDSPLKSLKMLDLRNLSAMNTDWFTDLLDSWAPRLQPPNHATEYERAPHMNELEAITGEPLVYLNLEGTVSDYNTLGLFADCRHTNRGQPSSLFGRSPRILTPALRHLGISGFPCNDDEIELLVKWGLCLHSIDISATDVTGAGIKMLVDGIPSLKSIVAHNTPRVTGRDSLDYAERRGVTVAISWAETGGKKVRHR